MSFFLSDFRESFECFIAYFRFFHSFLCIFSFFTVFKIHFFVQIRVFFMNFNTFLIFSLILNNVRKVIEIFILFFIFFRSFK